MESDQVCSECGAEVTQGRSGKSVHIQRIPDGYEPHDVPGSVERREWDAARADRRNVHVLASELILHHVAEHPMSDCPFATRLAEALRTT